MAALFTADIVTPKNRATSPPQYPVFLTANRQNSFLASITSLLLPPDRKSSSLIPSPLMDTLLRMQTAYEIAGVRDREADIKVKRYVAKPISADNQAAL